MMLGEVKKILFILVLVSLFLPTESFSQISELSVQDALQKAFENNPELNRMEQEVQVRSMEHRMAWGLESPDLYYFREGLDGDLFSEQRWGVSQTFAFPLRGYYQNQKARTETHAADLEFEAMKKSVRVTVKSAYAELAYAIKFVQIKEQEVELASELKEIAEARLEVGESTELDLIQAEIQLTNAENELNRAEDQKNRSRYALFTAIGLDPEQQQYGINYPDTLSFFDVQISQDLVMQNVSELPEVQSRMSQSDAALRGIQVARSSYLPDLRINYYRQDFGAGYDFYGFEVGISVPLWFGINESRNVKQAQAIHRQKEWSVNETVLSLKEQAENAWHSYETSRKSIISFRDFIQDRSESLLELTQEGYRMGELDLLRVLEAQRTYLNSQQQYYESLRNYYLQLIELERYLPNELVFSE